MKKYKIGQFVKHVHHEDPNHWIEAIVMREASEKGESFYQILVIDRRGYTVVKPGLPTMTMMNDFMDWKVLA